MENQKLMINVFKIKGICIPDHKVQIHFKDIKSFIIWVHKGAIYEVTNPSHNGNNASYTYHAFDDTCIGILNTKEKINDTNN